MEEEPKSKNRKNRKTAAPTFNVYLYKLLKNKGSLGITKEAINTLDYLIVHIGEEIERAVSIVKKYSKNKTIGVEDFNAALGLLVGLEHSKKVGNSANEYVNSYQDFLLNKKELKEIAEEKGEKAAYKPMQQNVKAGLTISVSRVKRVFMSHHNRISQNSMIYFTAVIEYILCEILEQTLVVMKKLNKQRIKTKHLTIALGNLNRYSRLTEKVYFSL